MPSKATISNAPPFRLHAAVLARGHRWYSQPGELNLVGIRTPGTVSGRFDDLMMTSVRHRDGRWHTWAFACTTDPGTYYLGKPLSPRGTAMLCQGQYEGAYRLGLHKGKYNALVQARPVRIVRGHDREALLYEGGTEEQGIYGINIHRAGARGTTDEVGRYSAGCQVLANAKDFETLMELASLHTELYGPAITYTLIDMRELELEARRTAGFAALVLAALLSLWESLRPRSKRASATKARKKKTASP